jgi:hypothetical protein
MGFIYPRNNKLQSPYLGRTRFRLFFTKIFVSDMSVMLTKGKPFLFLPFHCMEILKRLWKESGFWVFKNKELCKNKRGLNGGEVTE